MMVRFSDIQFCEQGGALDVVGEGADGGQGEGVQDGPEVQQAEVPTRAVLS